MWLSWRQALWLSVACLMFAGATARLAARQVLSASTSRRARIALGIRAVLGEVGVVAGLYALWQWVFARTVTRTDGAVERAQRIFAFQQRIGLPSELDVQRLTMRADWLIQVANRFYAYVHVPAMGVALAWMFFAHRDRYPLMRNTMAAATAWCLAVQSIPVAPPRFLPELGFVDTALLFDQSVYGTGGSGLSNQLAAMPSVHVAWAMVITVGVLGASRSRWRWLIVSHPVVTVWAVVATANHWWSDGIVAALFVLVCHAALSGIDRIRTGPGRARGDRPEPIPTSRVSVAVDQPARFSFTKSQLTRWVRKVSMNFGRALRWSR